MIFENDLGIVLLILRVDEDEEIIVKAMTDYWVVGKKSDQRELYVILNQKNANLIEVNGMSPPPGGAFMLLLLHLNTMLKHCLSCLSTFPHNRGGKETLCDTV